MNNIKINKIESSIKQPKIIKDLSWILKWLRVDNDWLVTSIKDWTYNCVTDPKTLSPEDKVYIIYECDFSLYFNEWTFRLVDRQWPCLWDIEDGKFKNLTEIMDRIEDSYVNDYFRWPFHDETHRKPEKYHFKIRRDEVQLVLNSWEKISRHKVGVRLKCKELDWTNIGDWGTMTTDILVSDKYKLNEYINSWEEIWYHWRVWEVKSVNKESINILFYDSNEIEEIDWVELLMQNWNIDCNESCIIDPVPNYLKTFELEFETYTELAEVDVNDILEILESNNNNYIFKDE